MAGNLPYFQPNHKLPQFKRPLDGSWISIMRVEATRSVTFKLVRLGLLCRIDSWVEIEV